MDLNEVRRKLMRRTDRGREAEELLSNPMLNDAFDKIEKYLRADWEITKAEDSLRREDIWRTLKLLKNIKDQIKSIAQSGKDANKEILNLNK